ncbi:hypothetical protein L3Q82_006071 [Scortum barcoo]|uniref:Uncharacterized protein n=1 Tax=Scortum barcoo TaxID=214431 RepID=A0ACB8X3V3_9TELE|nr:hypothetical protein L3Q82_006071 [Scortum barcoo]
MEAAEDRISNDYFCGNRERRRDSDEVMDLDRRSQWRDVPKAEEVMALVFGVAGQNREVQSSRGEDDEQRRERGGGGMKKGGLIICGLKSSVPCPHSNSATQEVSSSSQSPGIQERRKMPQAERVWVAESPSEFSVVTSFLAETSRKLRIRHKSGDSEIKCYVKVAARQLNTASLCRGAVHSPTSTASLAPMTVSRHIMMWNAADREEDSPQSGEDGGRIPSLGYSGKEGVTFLFVRIMGWQPRRGEEEEKLTRADAECMRLHG